MKLPSLSYLVQQSLRTYFRFPIALLDAIIGTIAAVVLINHEGEPSNKIIYNVIIVAALGIAFLTTIVLFGEKRKWSQSARLLAQSLGAAALVGYFFTLPADVSSAPSLHLIRFAMLVVGMHFLTAAAPFTGRDEVNGFWQYNKTLFLRFLTAMLYSGVLFAGLAVALEALEHLFGMNIPAKRYGQLWVIIMGIFNTWFFLAGVPENLDSLNASTEYPKGLKVFTQYILMPLVVIYLLILYAYAGKIIVHWNWPQGYVSKMILSFSITGILSLLLVQPIKEREENVWIKTVSIWYYPILIPLDIMLLLAIWRRISDYGITESRYVVLVLGIWLTGMTIYFTLGKQKNIKIIPSTLCVIAFLSAFGPWGAFQVSANSQLGRLAPLLAKNDILVNGKIHRDHRQVSAQDAKDITSHVTYLTSVHGVAPLQPWFESSLDTVGNQGGIPNSGLRDLTPRKLVAMMGVDYISQWETGPAEYVTFVPKKASVVEIEGYSHLIPLQQYGEKSKTIKLGDGEYTIFFDGKTIIVSITFSDNQLDSLRFDMQPVIKSLFEQYGTSSFTNEIPQEKLMTEITGRRIKAKICFHSLHARKSDMSMQSNFIDADLFVGLIVPHE
ncbi:MAG: DUF4153 domain-containing protein [Ignavibacteria bacterium]|nr:DUF4153 domain-containing protein [Ignavibacteria bacterium]MBI3765425.1 DUF4153 domain-containing protein [Ignavibacteriales bacterium]